jgi:hypothetical protein
MFDVGFQTESYLTGGGWCDSLLFGVYGFVLCPFVELQVGQAGGTMSTG